MPVAGGPLVSYDDLVELGATPATFACPRFERSGPSFIPHQPVEALPTTRERSFVASRSPVDASLADIEPSEKLAMGAYLDFEVLRTDRDRPRN